MSKMDKIPISSSDCALLVVDMQYDFLPDGALPVKEGDQIISGINTIIKKFYAHGAKIVFTQDWHPKKHSSFASVYPDKKPGDLISEKGLGPILWPDHCVQNSHGAEISSKILTQYGIAIIRKGYHHKIDSYSAFLENDKQTKTGLASFLKEIDVTKIFICGLALDYCCFYSALDAVTEGFEVYFLKDLTKGIDQPANNIQTALQKMKEAGIEVCSSLDLF